MDAQAFLAFFLLLAGLDSTAGAGTLRRGCLGDFPFFEGALLAALFFDGLDFLGDFFTTLEPLGSVVSTFKSLANTLQQQD